jgi:hypothetical protein
MHQLSLCTSANTPHQRTHCTLVNTPHQRTHCASVDALHRMLLDNPTYTKLRPLPYTQVAPQ